MSVLPLRMTTLLSSPGSTRPARTSLSALSIYRRSLLIRPPNLFMDTASPSLFVLKKCGITVAIDGSEDQHSWVRRLHGWAGDQDTGSENKALRMYTLRLQVVNEDCPVLQSNSYSRLGVSS